MGERIDHAAEALRMAEKSDSYLRSLEGIHMTDVQAVISQLAAVNGNLNALVHSQLALVEQQRVANLIALGALDGMAGYNPHETVLVPPKPDDPMRPVRQLKPEIKEALGL